MSFSFGVFKKGTVQCSKLFHPNENDINLRSLKKATRNQDKDMKGMKNEKNGDQISKCQRNYFL
jgi:hypothetical protein